MKIAITGATGFIGRNLIQAVKQNATEAEIVAVVRDSSVLDMETRRELRECEEIVSLDIQNQPNKVYEAIGKPDILIHLAWDGLPNYSSRHHFESELPLHYKFLSALARDGLKSLVVTGTCFEYGKQSGQLSESMPSIPDTPYGFAKNTLRQQLEYLQKDINLNLTWARLFYLYGDNQTGNSIYSQLKTAVKNGDSTFKMSNGEQLRDYLDVKRVANTILELALLEKNIGVINICSGNPISIRSLVENWLLEKSWKIKLNLGYYSYPEYESLAFWGCNKKLVSYLTAES